MRRRGAGASPRRGAAPERAVPPPRAMAVWMEVQGQRRLLRLRAQLQLRRQLVNRWSTLLDEADGRVKRRLEHLGGDSLGYDTQLVNLADQGGGYGELDDPHKNGGHPGHESGHPTKSATTSSATKKTATKRTATKKTATRRTATKKTAAKTAAKRAASRRTSSRRR